jgi:hypothetical protein
VISKSSEALSFKRTSMMLPWLIDKRYNGNEFFFPYLIQQLFTHPVIGLMIKRIIGS